LTSENFILGSQNEAHVEPSDGMAIAAEPLLDEEEVPLAVLGSGEQRNRKGT
jgi:hypothetical protein